jgi:hypothetical protein
MRIVRDFIRPLVIIFGTILLLIWLVFFMIFQLPEIKVQQSFHVYDDAKLVSESRGYYGGGSGQRSLYYWTKTPIEAIQKYFEQYFPQFTKQSGWLVSAYNVDGAPVNTNKAIGAFVHESICDFHKLYECVTVMLTSSHEGSNQLPRVMFPPTFTNISPPGSVALEEKGTLIIYNYWENNS